MPSPVSRTRWRITQAHNTTRNPAAAVAAHLRLHLAPLVLEVRELAPRVGNLARQLRAPRGHGVAPLLRRVALLGCTAHTGCARGGRVSVRACGGEALALPLAHAPPCLPHPPPHTNTHIHTPRALTPFLQLPFYVRQVSTHPRQALLLCVLVSLQRRALLLLRRRALPSLLRAARAGAGVRAGVRER